MLRRFSCVWLCCYCCLFQRVSSKFYEMLVQCDRYALMNARERENCCCIPFRIYCFRFTYKMCTIFFASLLLCRCQNAWHTAHIASTIFRNTHRQTGYFFVYSLVSFHFCLLSPCANRGKTMWNICVLCCDYASRSMGIFVSLSMLYISSRSPHIDFLGIWSALDLLVGHDFFLLYCCIENANTYR